MRHFWLGVLLAVAAVFLRCHLAFAQVPPKEDKPAERKEPAGDEGRPWVNFVPAAGRDLAFTPDGNFLAGVFGQDAEVWDLVKMQRVFALPTKENKSYGGFAFSADGKLLAFTDAEALYIYDTVTWKLKAFAPTAKNVSRKTAFTPDGKHVVVLIANGPGLISVINVASKRTLPWFKDVGACQDFALLGEMVFVRPNGMNDRFLVLSTKKPKLQAVELPHADDNRFYAFARQEKTKVAIGNLTHLNRKHHVEWYDAKTGRPLKHVLLDIPTDDPIIKPCGVSPDGTMALFQLHKGNAFLMDLTTGHCLAEIEYTSDRPGSSYAAFAPDSQRFATANAAAGATVLWDVKALAAAKKIQFPSQPDLLGSAPIRP